MRVAMIGTGYVGLVSGACFADFGHTVTCVDKDASKIERLHQNIMPIYEPGLDDLVANNVRDGRLAFAVDSAEAIRAAVQQVNEVRGGDERLTPPTPSELEGVRGTATQVQHRPQAIDEVAVAELLPGGSGPGDDAVATGPGSVVEVDGEPS